jgi:hypothetical protein
MPSIILDYQSALRALLEQSTYTGTKSSAHPLTANLSPEYEAFQVKYLTVQGKEIQLSIEILKASARITVADDAIDNLVDRISSALQVVESGGKGSGLYAFYFKGKQPSEHKKPVLAGQLETCRGWVEPLLSSPHAILNELGVELQKAVLAADDAVKALAAAKQANREFRTVGERRALFDEFNAMQKRNYGKIAELPHTEAGKGLPRTFAEQFFKKGARKQADEEQEPTSTDLITLIAEAEGHVEELKTRLAETLKAEQERGREGEARVEEAHARGEEARAEEGARGARGGREGRRGRGRFVERATGDRVSCGSPASL